MHALLQGLTRLGALMLAFGVSSAFGALYTFDLTNPTRIASTTGGGLVVQSDSDPAVTIQLTALATSSNSGSIVVITPEGAGVDDGQGGGNLSLDDIEGGASAEALILTPLVGVGPFSIESVTFTRTETLNGGDEAAVYLDNTAVDNCTPVNSCTVVDIGVGNVEAGGTFNWTPTSGTQTFNTNIAFRNTDGNDDYRISEIVLDITVGEVPEPSTWTLFGLGIAGLAWMRRRKRS